MVLVVVAYAMEASEQDLEMAASKGKKHMSSGGYGGGGSYGGSSYGGGKHNAQHFSFCTLIYKQTKY